MKPAPDAIVVDSTGLSIEEVVARLAEDVEPAAAEARPRRALTGRRSPK